MNNSVALKVLQWNVDVLGSDFYDLMGVTEIDVARLKVKLKKCGVLTQKENYVLLCCVRFCAKLSLQFALHFNPEEEVRMGTKFLTELKNELMSKVSNRE